VWQIVNANGLALFKESCEFDFESLLGKKLFLFFGIPVKIDRVIYDITGECVQHISGYFCCRGVKFRGYWDSMGNIIKFENGKFFQFGWKKDFKDFFEGMSESMFNLTSCKFLEDEKV